MFLQKTLLKKAMNLHKVLAFPLAPQMLDKPVFALVLIKRYKVMSHKWGSFRLSACLVNGLATECLSEDQASNAKWTSMLNS